MENPLEMRGLAFVEFASPRPDGLDRLFKALGFSRTHRHRTHALDAYRQGRAWFLIDHERASFAQRFMAEHGPSVSALGFAFEDPRSAFEAAVRRGAVPFDGRGSTSFDAPAIYGIGDALVYFVDAKGSFERELERVPTARVMREKGFLAVDHLTNNVPQGDLEKWSDFYKNVFGFVDVRSFDIEGTKSGLYSYALRSPCGTFSIPINEDKGDNGQIAEYLREYRGPGVQHIALSTNDILASVEAVGEAVEMLDIDDDYYEEAFRRVPNVREDRRRIEKNRVLLDGDAEGYLLQIFTKNVIGPIFFEIIQRENHFSFGEGNFSALFRSIEREQEKRGVL
jgi:4-hydroxyphenylpyruvate dioxygenase